MITIDNLTVTTDNKIILKNLNFSASAGQIHAIMGPNGAGKSTLTAVLAGNDNYQVDSGEIWFAEQNLLEMEVEERALAGLFIGFQSPIEIPGVTLINFLKAALEAKAKTNNQPLPSAAEILTLVRQKIEFLGLPSEFYKGYVNANLSGGQKKLSELLQMAVLEPKLAVLDEIDSGLDIDSVKLVATNLNKLRSPDKSIILITHYQRILNFVKPDFVHVLKHGTIVASGGPELVAQIEAKGYDQFN